MGKNEVDEMRKVGTIILSIIIISMCLAPFVTINSEADIGWVVQTSPRPGVALCAVANQFPKAWAVGIGQLIINTSDNGNTWWEQYYVGPGILRDVHFYDNNLGWAVGDTPDGVILHTSDGGQNWAPQSLPVGYEDVGLKAVRFAYDQSGIIVGSKGSDGYIFRTTDGGTNWVLKQQLVNQNTFGVDYLDLTHAWVTGASGSNGFVLFSDDGFTTYSAQSITATGYNCNRISFSGSTYGYIVAYHANDPSNNPGKVFKTENGGTTWDLLHTTSGNTPLLDVSYASSNWNTVGMTGTIIRGQVLTSNTEYQNSGTTQYLRGIDFGTGDIGWAVGDAGTILYTNTGGVPTLDHFEFDIIANPQESGTAFSITIRAMSDTLGTPFTDFTGTVTLSDTTGTITPTISGAFTSGVWTGDVTITQAQTGVTIDVSGGGKVGTSNSFDVISIPSAPQNLVATPGDSQVVLDWQAPSSDGGSAITNYRIYRGTTSGGETFLIEVGNVLTYTDTGVTNNQTYYYKIKAKNSVGESATYSNEDDATPVPTIPGATEPSAPQNLVATAGDGQVVLDWQAPSSDGGSAITNYRIYRGTTSGGETFLIEVGNVLTYTNTGLTNGQIYFYKVKAKNSVGESATYSNEDDATPISGVISVPSAPLNLIATAGDDKVVLNWQAPSSDGGSAITNYRIYRGTTSGGETFLIEVGNALTYTDTGVINNQTYYYKVKAKNSVGESIGYSNIANATPNSTSSSNENISWISLISIMLTVLGSLATYRYRKKILKIMGRNKESTDTTKKSLDSAEIGTSSAIITSEAWKGRLTEANGNQQKNIELEKSIKNMDATDFNGKRSIQNLMKLVKDDPIARSEFITMAGEWNGEASKYWIEFEGKNTIKLLPGIIGGLYAYSRISNGDNLEIRSKQYYKAIDELK
ncbi:MAG: fibronectin type III domain-containing protein [Candidatus Thermoplasmatota archaeon]|nr:fibronectin type III domain-containing protein [Candidatus Thermoplasmatota archaeon]